MRYTQPTILRADNAIAAIQFVGDPDTGKPIGPQLDSAVNPPQFTQAMAYEADE